MQVNRESLLRILESVTPGLATRELVEQSSCFVFSDGRVMAFNDEIFTSRKTPLKGVAGAVKAKPLLELLSRLPEDDVEISQTDEGLMVRGKRRKALIRMEQEVLLPVETVEVPEEWTKLDPDFSEAVSIVHSCASTEETQFVFCCVHIHPDYLEACDRFQIARYKVDSGVSGSMLVRATSLKRILGLDMTEIAETDAWLHFRNPTGLVLSCRRHLDEYKSLDKFLSADGTNPVTLPAGLEEIVAKAEIFSGENAAGNHVLVDLRNDRVVIEGEGASGYYREMKKVKFGGKPIQFLIAPKLLVEVSNRSNDCGVGKGRLVIDGGKFKFATSTTLPSSKEDKDEELEEAEVDG